MADGTASGLPPLEEMTHPEGIPALPPAQNRLLSLDSNLMATIAVGLLVPFLLSLVISKSRKKDKVRAVTCEVGGESGLTKRNQRFLSLVETPWEGADTLAVLFEQACHQYAGNKCLGTREIIKKETETGSDGRQFEKVTLGEYTWLKYGDSLPRVENLSSGIMALGHKKGDRVAIFAETRAEWLLALQACFRQNLQVVTIYASLGEEALVHSLNETEVTTVICDRKQLKKLMTMSDQCETVKHAVYMEDMGDDSQISPTGSSSEWAIESFSNVEKLGQQAPVPPNLPKPGDVAVIMYTSGSTGLPKGVVMSHANIVATVAGVSTVISNLNKNDVYLAYLPLAHVLELLAEVTMIAAGASIGYGSPLTLTDTSNKIKHGTKGDTTQLKPTLMTAVPAILDRVRDGVRKKVDGTGTLVKTLFNIAYKRRVMAIEGSWFGAWGVEKMLWDAVVFKKIKLSLGGRVRGMLSGGAPLSRDTQRFINVCFGAPIGQGYGLTETCAGATFSEWDDNSVGRVGPPVPHCYVKLVNWDEGNYKITDNPPRGEIVVGGPSVTMGYFKNQEKTDEVFKVDDRDMRWFYTGDIGQFHEDGCIEIIDRKKDIVKLQAGEYVSLGKVEAVLAGSSYVDNVMLHADPFHSYTVALIVANAAALEAWAKKAGVDYSDFSDLCSKPEACKEVLSSLSQAAKQGKLQRFEIPTKVKLLPEPWTPDSGLVTAAMKLKREAVRKAFTDDLKALYT